MKHFLYSLAIFISLGSSSTFSMHRPMGIEFFARCNNTLLKLSHGRLALARNFHEVTEELAKMGVTDDVFAIAKSAYQKVIKEGEKEYKMPPIIGMIYITVGTRSGFFFWESTNHKGESLLAHKTLLARVKQMAGINFIGNLALDRVSFGMSSDLDLLSPQSISVFEHPASVNLGAYQAPTRQHMAWLLSKMQEGGFLLRPDTALRTNWKSVLPNGKPAKILLKDLFPSAQP